MPLPTLGLPGRKMVLSLSGGVKPPILLGCPKPLGCGCCHRLALRGACSLRLLVVPWFCWGLCLLLWLRCLGIGGGLLLLLLIVPRIGSRLLLLLWLRSPGIGCRLLLLLLIVPRIGSR